MTQRGFLSPTLMLVIGLAVTTLAAAMFYQLWRAKAHELESFRVAVEVAGDAQNEKSKAENARLLKERDDADKKLGIARADLKRLRSDNSRGRSLSGTAPGAAVPVGTVCYDRPELDRAYGVLVQELRGISDEGAACAVSLENARGWAGSLPRSTR